MKPILVFGSINLDIGVRVPRLPVAGETLMGSDSRLSPGGKGANQAHAARQYGAAVRMVGAVGHDDFAHAAMSGLERVGVNTFSVRHMSGCATGLATIHVTESGENAIVVSPGANAEVRSEWVGDELLSGSSMLLLQWELPPAEVMALARRAKAMGTRVMLNLAPAHTLGVFDPAVIDWLVVNESELAAITRARELSPHADKAVEELARSSACHVALTRGAEGVLVCGPQGERFEQAALPVRVVDTTGAGDTFCGVLAAALSMEQDIPTALRCASVAASLACTRSGAQTAQPTRLEVDQHAGAL